MADPSARRNPHAEPVPENSFKDPSLWGTIYDREIGEWQCIECGCAFTDEEGARSVTEDILGDGVEHPNQLDRQSGTRAHAYAKALQRFGR